MHKPLEVQIKSFNWCSHRDEEKGVVSVTNFGIAVGTKHQTLRWTAKTVEDHGHPSVFRTAESTQGLREPGAYSRELGAWGWGHPGRDANTTDDTEMPIRQSCLWAGGGNQEYPEETPEEREEHASSNRGWIGTHKPGGARQTCVKSHKVDKSSLFNIAETSNTIKIWGRYLVSSRFFFLPVSVLYIWFVL